MTTAQPLARYSAMGRASLAAALPSSYTTTGDTTPTGRNPNARQADYTNAPSSARRCLAARDADFIEASGHMCRTERPDIWAHRLPQDKVAIISLARRGRSTYGMRLLAQRAATTEGVQVARSPSTFPANIFYHLVCALTQCLDANVGAGEGGLEHFLPPAAGRSAADAAQQQPIAGDGLGVVDIAPVENDLFGERGAHLLEIRRPERVPFRGDD